MGSVLTPKRSALEGLVSLYAEIKPNNISQNHYQRVNSFFPQGCFCTSTDGRFVQNAVSGFLKSCQVQQFKDLLPFRAVRAASAGSTKRNCVGQKGCISFKQVCEQPQCLAGCLPHLKNCENQILMANSGIFSNREIH